MTMAWGLEAREPFLDQELVELAARVPAQYNTRIFGFKNRRETAYSKPF